MSQVSCIVCLALIFGSIEVTNAKRSTVEQQEGHLVLEVSSAGVLKESDGIAFDQGHQSKNVQTEYEGDKGEGAKEKKIPLPNTAEVLAQDVGGIVRVVDLARIRTKLSDKAAQIPKMFMLEPSPDFTSTSWSLYKGELKTPNVITPYLAKQRFMMPFRHFLTMGSFGAAQMLLIADPNYFFAKDHSICVASSEDMWSRGSPNYPATVKMDSANPLEGVELSSLHTPQFPWLADKREGAMKNASGHFTRKRKEVFVYNKECVQPLQEEGLANYSSETTEIREAINSKELMLEMVRVHTQLSQEDKVGDKHFAATYNEVIVRSGDEENFDALVGVAFPDIEWKSFSNSSMHGRAKAEGMANDMLRKLQDTGVLDRLLDREPQVEFWVAGHSSNLQETDNKLVKLCSGGKPDFWCAKLCELAGGKLKDYSCPKKEAVGLKNPQVLEQNMESSSQSLKLLPILMFLSAWLLISIHRL